MIDRHTKWNLLKQFTFDVAVIGGGINGACLYNRLCAEGYSVLLLDQGDFAGGTSQASAMMAWGGLLYLTTLDLASVWQLSVQRDRLIGSLSHSVKPKTFRYVSGKSKSVVQSALYLYWILGLCRRKKPYVERQFPESKFLSADLCSDSLVYEEACLQPSDARFVLNWIEQYQSEWHIPLNYCSLVSGTFDSDWNLELRNELTGEETCTRAKLVINAAGVWTDLLNERFAINTPYKHVFGKGVFVGFRRFPGHERPLIIDSGQHDQSLSLIPWGPVSLWGPTETKVDSLESGFRVDPADIHFLLDRLNSHLRTRVDATQILSLRCGIRPLAVDRCYSGNEATLKISRRHRVYADPARPWISLYGGKITSCMALAEETLELLRESPLRQVSHSCKNILTSATAASREDSPPREDAQTRRRVDALCCRLEDYLRRRTNISQWVTRGGLGWKNENRSKLLAIALRIHRGNQAAAEEDLRNYETKIVREFDDVISRCKAS